MNQTAEQKADALLLSMIFPERFPMNQTLVNPTWPEVVAQMRDQIATLQRDLAKAKDEAENQRQAAIMNAEQRAKANADKAVLVEALEGMLRWAEQTEGGGMRYVNEPARAALSQVQVQS